MTYDEMILRGPEERPEPVMVTCEACDGTGRVEFSVIDGTTGCTECDGAGEVEETADEPEED